MKLVDTENREAVAGSGGMRAGETVKVAASAQVRGRAWAARSWV